MKLISNRRLQPRLGCPRGSRRRRAALFRGRDQGHLFADDLRDKENAKIECGRAHFRALAVGENPARYKVKRNVGELLADL